MTSGSRQYWTSGNALSWVVGVLMGGLIGVILLIAIPRTLGGAAKTTAASEAASSAASTSSGDTSSADTSGSSETASAAGADGQAVYASECAACHGPDAGGAVGPKLDEAAAWTMAQFTAAVREGKAPDRALAPMMPHFGTDKVSDAQLSALHDYLQNTFGVGKEDTASSSPGADGEQIPGAASDATQASTAGEANTAVQTPTTAEGAAADGAVAEGDSAAGKEKFAGMCAGCHGANAEGGLGPKLDQVKGWTQAQFTEAVREGKAPDKTLSATMPHFGEGQLSAADLANIHAFLNTVN